MKQLARAIVGLALVSPAIAKAPAVPHYAVVADIAGPAYVIDDQTAIKVTDTVEVVSEGRWKLFP